MSDNVIRKELNEEDPYNLKCNVTRRIAGIFDGRNKGKKGEVEGKWIYLERRDGDYISFERENKKKRELNE